MTDSEIRALIEQEVTAQLQAMNTKDIASETDIPTLSDAEWDTNNALTSMPVVYNGSTWRKIGLSFLRTLRNAAAVINTAWNSLTNNGTNVTWIPTVNSSGVAGKSSPADLASVLGVVSKFPLYVSAKYNSSTYYNVDDATVPGMYWLKNATSGNPYGVGYEGILFVLKYNEKPCVCQIALRGGDDKGIIKYRWRNGSEASWVGWKTLSTT